MASCLCLLPLPGRVELPFCLSPAVLLPPPLSFSNGPRAGRIGKGAKLQDAFSLPSRTPSRASGGLSLPPSTPRSCKRLRTEGGSSPKPGASRPLGRSSPGQSVSRVSPGPAGDTACSLESRPSRSVAVSHFESARPQSVSSSAAAAAHSDKTVRVKPKLVGLPSLPAHPTEVSLEPSVWWKCDIPGCGHVVYKKPGVAGHSQYRKDHLRNVHGISNPPSLRGGNELSSRPQRLDKQMKPYDRRWETQCNALVRRGWWAGAHQFTSSGPDAWRAYKRKGTTCWRPLHKCVACNREVPRAEIPVSPCPQAARALVPAKARKVRQACAKESKDAVAKDRRKRNKGLSRKEVCRRARAGRWGHDIGNIAPNGKQSAARS